MENKILYPNFLENKRTYNLAQGAWKRLLNKVLKDFGYTYTPYLNELQNGKKEYDGNPIFNAYIPEIRLVPSCWTLGGTPVLLWSEKYVPYELI